MTPGASDRGIVEKPSDAEYIRYYAGVQPVYLPSFCGYAARGVVYAPDPHKPVLFARNHNNPAAIYDEARRAQFLCDLLRYKHSYGGDVHGSG